VLCADPTRVDRCRSWVKPPSPLDLHLWLAGESARDADAAGEVVPEVQDKLIRAPLWPGFKASIEAAALDIGQKRPLNRG